MPALPAAIVAAGQTISAALATQVIGTITVGNILTAAYVVGSAIDTRNQRRAAAADARRRYLDSLQGRAVMVRSAVEPRKLVYGLDVVSGPLADMFTTGTNDEYLHLIVALVGRRVHAIPSVRLNEFDIAVSSLDGDGNVTSGQWVKVEEGRTFTDTVTANGSGVATLPRAASSVKAVVTTTGAGDSQQSDFVTGWAHTTGASTVSGLPAGQVVSISYTQSLATPCVRIHVFTGAPGETIPAALLAETAGRRTSAHAGTGLAWVWVRLRWSQDVFGTIGVPNISATVQGCLVRDPRSGTTAYSPNAALCTADYILDQTQGLGSPAATVPDAELIAEANICDEAVALDAGGATQARYTVNGALSAGDARLDNLEALIDSMAGHAVWTQGRWAVRAGAYRTPQPLTITEDTLGSRPPSLQRRPPRRELVNAVRARYRDAALGYTETTTPLVANATYRAQDGGRQVVRDIRLPLVNDSLRAQRLAKIVLERARQATTISLQTSLRGYNLLPGQVVPVKLARYGWAVSPFADGKPMEVRRRAWNAQAGTVDYVLRETSAGVYAWAYGEATVIDDAPDTALPSPWQAPAAISGLAVSSGASVDNVWTQSDGTRVTRALASWTAVTERMVLDGGRIELRWADAVGGQWQALPPLPGDATSAYITPVPDRRVILVEARTVNAAARGSAWVTVLHLVQGAAAVPADVTGVTLTPVPGGLRITWAPNSASTVANRTRVKVGASWAAGTVLWDGPGVEFTWPWPGAGTHTLRLKHVNTSGVESEFQTIATVTVGDNILIKTPDLGPESVGLLRTATEAAPVGNDMAWLTIVMPYAGQLNCSGSGFVKYVNSSGSAELARGYPYMQVEAIDGSIVSSIESDGALSATVAAGASYESMVVAHTVATVTAGTFRVRFTVDSASTISPPYPVDFVLLNAHMSVTGKLR